MKTVEELLQDRYKLIADYPLSNMYFDIGTILTLDRGRYTCPDTRNKKKNMTIISMAKETIENYPHLFKKLEWWEERNVEDMPEYVKGISHIFKDRLYKVLAPLEDGRLYHDDNEIEHRSLIAWAEFLIPTTEEEYLSFINS